MKLIFLTRFHSQQGQHTLGQRLMQAALAQGHELQIINPAEVVLEFNHTQGKMPVFWQGQPYPQGALTLPMARWDDAHTWQIAETLQSWGTPTSLHQRLPLGDHVTMARLLARNNLPAPRSWVLAQAEQIGIILPELVFPILMRSRYGGTGRKVVVVQHSGDAYTQAAQLAASGQSFLVQDLPQPFGEDVRALVVGGKILAALQRQAPAGFVRPREASNPHVAPTQLSAPEQSLVLTAARMYGGPFCAISLLRTAQGPLMLEFSRVPTLVEFEQTFQADFASPIIAELGHIAENLALLKPGAKVVPLNHMKAV
jgi:ribosomal protein S6--L-glutamate ligase